MPEHSKHLLEDLNYVGTKHLCIEVKNLSKAVKELKAKDAITQADVDKAKEVLNTNIGWQLAGIPRIWRRRIGWRGWGRMLFWHGGSWWQRPLAHP